MADVLESGFVAEPVTPERATPLGLKLARRLDVGDILLRRWAGCWIDLIVVALLFFVPVALTPGAAPWPGIVGLMAAIAYYPVTEAMWGRTLGKRITGTVVVDQHGARPGVVRILVRTAFRLIEVNPFLIGGLPAGIVVAATPTRQRLGDLVAGTYVVHKRDLNSLSPRLQASLFD